jgi:hypothetical protein
VVECTNQTPFFFRETFFFFSKTVRRPSRGCYLGIGLQQIRKTFLIGTVYIIYCVCQPVTTCLWCSSDMAEDALVQKIETGDSVKVKQVLDEALIETVTYFSHSCL